MSTTAAPRDEHPSVPSATPTAPEGSTTQSQPKQEAKGLAAAVFNTAQNTAQSAYDIAQDVSKAAAAKAQQYLPAEVVRAGGTAADYVTGAANQVLEKAAVAKQYGAGVATEARKSAEYAKDKVASTPISELVQESAAELRNRAGVAAEKAKAMAAGAAGGVRERAQGAAQAGQQAVAGAANAARDVSSKAAETGKSTAGGVRVRLQRIVGTLQTTAAQYYSWAKECAWVPVSRVWEPTRATAEWAATKVAGALETLNWYLRQLLVRQHTRPEEPLLQAVRETMSAEPEPAGGSMRKKAE